MLSSVFPCILPLYIPFLNIFRPFLSCLDDCFDSLRFPHTIFHYQPPSPIPSYAPSTSLVIPIHLYIMYFSLLLTNHSPHPFPPLPSFFPKIFHHFPMYPHASPTIFHYLNHFFHVYTWVNTLPKTVE